jgi:ATP-dependent Clp protease ATP-binding subunit ClpA
VGETDIQRLLHMEETLRRQVVGQDEAVRSVSQATRRAAAGLKDPKRPVATFVFLGPSGTSKIQLARELAGFLYGDRGALVHLEMSKYQGKHALTDLLGIPSGVGGELYESVRRRPDSVIVFEDIEQADGHVLEVFFEMRDEGVIRGGHRPALDIRNGVVIACSNVWLERIPPPVGQCSVEEWRRCLIAVGDEIEEKFPFGFPYRCEFVFFHAEPHATADGGGMEALLGS